MTRIPGMTSPAVSRSVADEVGEASDGQDFVDAACRYRGFTHRRRILFAKADALLFVLDEVVGPPGDRLLELFWHPGEPTATVAPNCFRIGRRALLAVAAPAMAELSLGGENGWRSSALYEKREAPVILARLHSALPASLATVIDLAGGAAAGQAELLADASEQMVRWKCGGIRTARFGPRAILDRER